MSLNKQWRDTGPPETMLTAVCDHGQPGRLSLHEMDTLRLETCHLSGKRRIARYWKTCICPTFVVVKRPAEVRPELGLIGRGQCLLVRSLKWTMMQKRNKPGRQKLISGPRVREVPPACPLRIHKLSASAFKPLSFLAFEQPIQLFTQDSDVR